MTIDDQIMDEKIQYGINREASKIPALSSGKMNKYECLTGEEILPSNQKQIIEQDKFTYSPLGKVFEKQTKTIEDQGEKLVDALKFLELSNMQLPSIKDFILKKAKSWNYKQARKNWRRRKKLVEVKWFTNGILKRMIFENLKQYVLWVIELWNLLLICTWQMINKTIWQSILKNLKSGQDHNKIMTYKSKRRHIK